MQPHKEVEFIVAPPPLLQREKKSYDAFLTRQLLCQLMDSKFEESKSKILKCNFIKKSNSLWLCHPFYKGRKNLMINIDGEFLLQLNKYQNTPGS